MAQHFLEYEGCNFLRQRLILSTLSGKAIRISKIRHKEEDLGLKAFEASLLKLLEKISNGAIIEISVTGSTLVYKPGILIGGSIEHECNLERDIGYYLEILLCLAPFCKNRLTAVLKGITNGQTDPTVDFIKATSLPLMRHFGIINDLNLKVVRRSFAPEGGGEIVFECPCLKKLKPIHLSTQSKIKRIRGTAFAARVSPQIPNRIIESTRSVLNRFIPDIYIYSDHLKGNQSGKAPGFGLCLVAETTEGTLLAAEGSSAPKGSSEIVIPEDLGKEVAYSLLEEIYRGGCIDSSNQHLAALFMILGEQDVSKILTGTLTPYMVQFLRHIRDFFQVLFKLETVNHNPDEAGGKLGGSKVLLTCIGVGFSNISKTIR